MKEMKTICFSADEELLRAVHIRAAEFGISMQEYITDLIQKDLHPNERIELTPERLEELHTLAEQTLETMERMRAVLEVVAPEQTMLGGMRFG